MLAVGECRAFDELHDDSRLAFGSFKPVDLRLD